MHLASQSDRYASCPVGGRFRLSRTKSGRKTADDPETIQVKTETIVEETAEPAQIHNKKEYRAFKIIDTKQEKPEQEGLTYWFETRAIRQDPFEDFTSEVSQPAWKPKQYKMTKGNRNVRAAAGTHGKKQTLHQDTVIAETGLPAHVEGKYEFRAFEVISNNNGGLAAQGKIIWMMVREVQDEFSKYTNPVHSPQWMMKKDVTGKVVADAGVAGFPDLTPGSGGYQASDAIAVIQPGTKVKYDRNTVAQHTIHGESYLMARCSFPDSDVKEKINGSALSGAWMIVSPDVVVTTEREHIDFDSVQSFGSDSAYTVKAGDPVGYLGLYEIPDEHNTRDLKKVIRMIHFEQLSKDEPPEGFFKLLMKEEAVKKLIRIEDKDSDGYLDENEPPTIFDELSQLLSDEPDKPVVRVEDKIKNLSGWDKCKPVIACHESEWYEEEKSYLDKILELFSHPDTEELIGHEKERIKNLVWMKQETQVQFEKHVWHWWPVARNCFCNRDCTVEEVKKIVKSLREVDNIDELNLFTASNCNISGAEKTYERFTEELNKAMKKYNINTCIRKAHFIAQIYHETDKLRTTKEYSDGKEYDPILASTKKHRERAIKNGNTIQGDGAKYKGRGLMQLTWKKNYKKYKEFSKFDCISNYSKISDELFYAVDSAGWYWTKGSLWGNLNPKADDDD